jgi:hypothetical protein
MSLRRRDLLSYAAAVATFAGWRVANEVGGESELPKPAGPVECDLVTLLCLGRSACASTSEPSDV